MGYFPTVGIIGPRQVGKTTLAKAALKDTKQASVYLDLENPEDEAKLFDPLLFFRDNSQKCIILDEIQRKPELFPILRSIIDEDRRPGRFILLGSASPGLIRDSSESLAGRIAYLELSPFHLIETGTSMESMNQLWLRGGFPQSFLAPQDRYSRDWRGNFIRTYIERDLPLLGLNADRNLIMRLWRMLAHMHGNVINFSALSRSLGITSNTVKKYVYFMENAFLVRLIEPYHANVKKRLVKSPKVFVRDSGIAHQLWSTFTLNDLLSNPYLGASWEGFVIDQIFAIAGRHFDLAFYRTHEGAECDLVLMKADKPVVGIEIKYTSSPKPTKGMLQSFQDLKTNENFIITPMSDDFALTETLRACSLSTFLEKYLSKLIA